MDESSEMNHNSNNAESVSWNATTNKSTGSSSDQLFYDVIWPSLVVQGWKKERLSESGDELFFPPGTADAKKDVLGKDYFNNIDAVAIFISKRNEKNGSDLIKKSIRNQRNSITMPYVMNEAKELASPLRRRSSRVGLSPEKTNGKQWKTMELQQTHKKTTNRNTIDESWKVGCLAFRKRDISVGSDYQVTYIPKAGSYLNESPVAHEPLYELLWDPKQADRVGIKYGSDTDVLAKVPSNVKEKAIFEFAKNGYSIKKIEKILPTLQPSNGSDWNLVQKQKYHNEIFRVRKDFKALCTALEISFGTCLAYYLNYYKFTRDYRILKSIRSDERQQKVESAEFVVDSCVVCGEGGNLLICDECEGEYHLHCTKPPLAEIPEGRWECDECVDKKLVKVRDHLLQTTSMFEKYTTTRKRPFDLLDNTINDDDLKGTTFYRPKESVLETVRRFAHEAHSACSNNTNNSYINNFNSR